MKRISRWPKRPTTWITTDNTCPACRAWEAVSDGNTIACLKCGFKIKGSSWSRTLFISVPFTWDMRSVRSLLRNRSFLWDKAVIGGPGAYLCLHYYPDFLSGIPNVEVGEYFPGVLQRVNPDATRTTYGCVRHCGFCGIGQGIIEPGAFWSFWPLFDWRDLPVLVDNNILAAPREHFDRVIDRLKQWGWCDFNQGLDARLLTPYHAGRIAEIAHPIVRLALDSQLAMTEWGLAYAELRRAGIRQHDIRSYALIGYDSDPAEAWQRCEWIESVGVKALPMWYHPLNSLKHNAITDEQALLGWNDYERRRIMQYYYQHKEAVRYD